MGRCPARRRCSGKLVAVCGISDRIEIDEDSLTASAVAGRGSACISSIIEFGCTRVAKVGKVLELMVLLLVKEDRRWSPLRILL